MQPWTSSILLVSLLGNIVTTRMVSRENLSSPLYALVTSRHVKNSVIRPKPNNIMLRQQTQTFFFFIYIFMNQKFPFMIFTLVNDHFIV